MGNSEDLIELTEKAIHHIGEILKQENQSKNVGIRFGVIGGGCSGLSYKIEFSEENKLDKSKIVDDKLKIFTRVKSAGRASVKL